LLPRGVLTPLGLKGFWSLVLTRGIRLCS